MINIITTIYILIMMLSALLVFRKLIRNMDAKIEEMNKQINDLFNNQYEY